VSVVGVLLSAAPFSVVRAAEGPEEKVDGYAEFKTGDCLLVDAQRVCPAPGMKFKGEGEAKDAASIPLGYEVKAKGRRRTDGALLARELEAKPNKDALFENEVRSATNQAEEKYRRVGRFYEEGSGGRIRNIGQIDEEGPRWERARRIVDSLLPPYLHPEDIRVYVIQNKEWNAFAMGNYAIYVFSGLLDDMDDDEVGIVLGHELAHASHEHTRKQVKKQMWIQLAAAGVAAAAESIDDGKKRVGVQLAATFTALAWSNGYGRSQEDQADRVGLRYAYEAGYDVTKGPRLWNRFAKKYGESGKVATFFFGDHSQSSARAAKLEKELAYNYPDGPRPDGAALRRAVVVARANPNGLRVDPGAASALGVTSAAASLPAATSALASTAPPRAAGPVDRGEIQPGMSPDQVRQILGAPGDELVFGEKTRWTYPDLTVVFEKGKVKEVKF
jgi:Zn-dependent protease with chaperone function